MKSEKLLFEYYPDKGIKIDGLTLNWKENRTDNRKKLKNSHTAKDKTFDIGDGKTLIISRKDIYKNYNSKENYFFLKYDENDKLQELEVHIGATIKIIDFTIGFDQPLSNFIDELKDHKIEVTEMDRGNYLIPDYKMTMADDEHMGGNGFGLSYFYATDDISHLTK
ncbi:hypothetical protein VOI54_12460 [Tamlana sp. 2201CG12-4]|uniref:hypothetical protein n=1 Tax=Tamlana sp. 2201CG12-4 TaxID=3112582 RepID=UPI002DB8D3EA|nr:hypothetical protein [Tamlana sp. 2201CG12-4]MEC3907833.1 hypothetical protein [Tamlana sp. 2201CG12-4]